MYLIYLFQRQDYRKRERDLPSTGSLAKWLTWSDLGQTKARTWSLMSNVSNTGRLSGHEIDASCYRRCVPALNGGCFISLTVKEK